LAAVGLRSGTFATIGGSIFVAFGILSLAMTSLVSSAVSLSTNQFLELWGGTILALAFGFLIIIAGALIGSSSSSRRLAGGALGTISSLIGGFNVPVYLTNTIGVGSTSGVNVSAGGGAQLSTFLLMLIIGALVTLFAGFPLSMVGSFPVSDRSEGVENSS